MKTIASLFFLCLTFLLFQSFYFKGERLHGSVNIKPVEPDSVIQVIGDEQEKVNLERPDGGLPLLPEVINIELLRTTRDAPELADGDGWTYAHHMDLAEWRGRMYAAWNMTLKDEDVLPSKVVYASSTDGIEWSKPADLFPRELAWACRFYFYHTENDKMLTFCAARVSDGNVSEALKTVLLVREINPNHQLGEVFTLINPSEKMPPFFETSSDQAFVEACREAVNNNMLLEQQDYGMFLGDRKMEWHEKTPLFKGFYKFGKAFCFYKRPDNQWVGMTKMGFVTTSDDGGKIWSEPVLPPTLVVGAAKVWGQRTRDDEYVLSYNPDPNRSKRFPLVMVHGDDGIHFKAMRVVHGEYPPLRYPGKYKDYGYQYVRGVASWSTDNSFADKESLWLIYSVNKEDIWLSRIPLPIKTKAMSCPFDNFQNMKTGAIIPGWNIYSPKWAPVRIVKEPGKEQNLCLEFRDFDPTDYARAIRLFPSDSLLSVEFKVKPNQANGRLEAEVQNENGNPYVSVIFNEDGLLKAVSGESEINLGAYQKDKWISFKLDLNTETQTINITCLEKTFLLTGVQNEPQANLQRFVCRTGFYRGLGDVDLLDNRKDQPLQQPVVFLVDDVSVKLKSK